MVMSPAATTVSSARKTEHWLSLDSLEPAEDDDPSPVETVHGATEMLSSSSDVGSTHVHSPFAASQSNVPSWQGTADESEEEESSFAGGYASVSVEEEDEHWLDDELSELDDQDDHSLEEESLEYDELLHSEDDDHDELSDE